MSAIPIAAWQHSLVEMESALGSSLLELDRHRAALDALPTRHTVAPEFPTAHDILSRLEGRLGEWDAKIAAAAELGGSVQRELQEGESAIAQWQQACTAWRERIERRMDSSVTGGLRH